MLGCGIPGLIGIAIALCSRSSKGNPIVIKKHVPVPDTVISTGPVPSAIPPGLSYVPHTSSGAPLFTAVVAPPPPPPPQKIEIDLGFPKSWIQFLANRLKETTKHFTKDASYVYDWRPNHTIYQGDVPYTTYEDYQQNVKQYGAWLSKSAIGNCVINIQLDSDHHSRKQTNKISFEIEEDGTCLSVRNDGVPSDKFDEKKPVIKGLIEHFQAIMLSDLKKKFKENTNDKNTFEFFSEKTKYYAWYNPKLDVLCIQPGRYHFGMIDPITKRRTFDLFKVGLKITSSGMIEEMYVHGEKAKSLEPGAFGPLFTMDEQTQGVPTSDELKMLLTYLQTHHNAKDKFFAFKIANENYALWFDAKTKCLEIQPLKDLGERSRNKLTLFVDGNERITHARFDGAPLLNERGKAAISTPFLRQDKLILATRAIEAVKLAMDNKKLKSQITHSQMVSLQAYLKMQSENTKQIYVPPKRYNISLINDTIVIESDDKKEKRTITILAERLLYEGNMSDELTLMCLKDVLFILCRDVSKYSRANGVIYITVLKSSLKTHPLYHLQNLANQIEYALSEFRSPPTISVAFLNDDLTPSLGIDVGGLARGYFNGVFNGVISELGSNFTTVEPSSLLMPRTTTPYVMQQDDLPSLNIINSYMPLRDLGKVMLYCFHSGLEKNKKYLTGVLFDPALFNAIAHLTQDEIERPHWDIPTRIKIVRSLVHAYGNKSYDRRLNLYEKRANLSEVELQEAAALAFYAGCLPDALKTKIGTVDEDVDTTQVGLAANKPIVIKALYDSIFGSVSTMGQFGAQIQPLYEIVAGMREFSSQKKFLDGMRRDHFLQISEKIQGKIDRTWLIGRIRYQGSNQEVIKKLNWLKEWLADETTPVEHFRTFVQFVTGTAGLPADRYIEVNEVSNHNYPVPKSHTCFMSFDLSTTPRTYKEFNDHTKENFIHAIINLVLPNADQYSDD